MNTDNFAKCSCGRDVNDADVCTFDGCKTLNMCVGCSKEADRCSCVKL